MTALYNEIDPKAAAWLRELIQQGHIAPGIVDERSIEDLDPDYLRQFVQVHFFAGIGVWSYALRRAGWRDDEPVWTGSCPCQPFSAAGKGAGFADERHLWPAFHWLIEQRRPDVVLGEQVASKDGLAWLDLVSSDLEASGYAAGAADTCAAGFGAPHIRQRLYWCALADANDARLEGRRQSERGGSRELLAGPGGLAGGLADAERIGGRSKIQAADLRQPETDRSPDRVGRYSRASRSLAQPHDPEWRADLPRGHEPDGPDAGRPEGPGDAGAGGGCGGLADAARSGRREERQNGRGLAVGDRAQGLAAGLVDGVSNLGRPGPTNGLWGDADWLLCRDGKWRPVEPGTFPLAHGSAARVGRLRGYGNAIVAPQAQAFVEVVREWRAASDLC